jgi:hypothetical protein
MGARSNGILIARAKTRTAQGRLSIKLEKSRPMAFAAKFRGRHPFFHHAVPMAPEHSPVSATVRDGAGQCPLCGGERTLSERIATSEFDPNRSFP